jgi:hypothetical protein
MTMEARVEKIVLLCLLVATISALAAMSSAPQPRQ